MMPTGETRVYIIHWNDLAKYLKKGMQVITVMPGPGAETTMLAIVPDELVKELEKHGQGKRKPSLREILADMAGWAALQPGTVKRAKLTGGLGIDIIWGIDGMWRLQIWREGSEPSLKEWETVLKSWPEPAPEVAYKRFAHPKRSYMQGEWKVIDESISSDIPGGDAGSTGSQSAVRSDGDVLSEIE